MHKVMVAGSSRVVPIAVAGLAAACLTVVSLGLGATPAYADTTYPIYRLYQPATSEHLYTTDAYEAQTLYINEGWGYEGVSWYAPETGSPVYRLYNETLGVHHYTADQNEAIELTTNQGWNYDNDGNPLFYSGGSVPVYRLYNEDLNSLHHLTTDASEYNTLPDYGWTQEGEALYAVTTGVTYTRTHYWPEDMSCGWKYDTDGVLRYFINEVPQSGWIVAASPDDANDIERYYVDPALMSTVTGWFEVDGNRYFANGAYGAVLRNTCWRDDDGVWLEFDNEGVGTPSATLTAMAAEAQNHTSSTNWLILVDTTTDYLGIFQSTDDGWVLADAWRVACGSESSPTTLGEYTITGRGESFDGTRDDGVAYTCYWYTQFNGNYLFHSVTYYQGTYNILDPTLGSNVSDGCVRMDIDYAQWIYDNIDDNTGVYIY